MLRHLLTTGGALLAICHPARAQDTPHPVSTGFRVEGLIGFDAAGFDSITSGDGLLYGVGLGYDLGSGRFRFGVEAEASESTARTCGPLIGLDGSLCLRAARDLYVGGRIGFEVEPGVLLYGKAGYSNFRESVSLVLPEGAAVFHPEVDGFRLGLGAEFAVGRRTFVKTEYRFTNYELSQDFDRHQAVIGFGFRF